MAVNQDNQRHMDDEEIQNGELLEALLGQLNRWKENQTNDQRYREAHKAVVAAQKKIKELLPMDGKPHRYIVGDCIIEVSETRGGGHREFDASPRQDVKITQE